jgi:hypothetical protein
MEVEEILDCKSYFNHKPLANKNRAAQRGTCCEGWNNIWRPLSNGHFQKLRSMHSIGDKGNAETKGDALSGVNLLVAEKKCPRSREFVH